MKFLVFTTLLLLFSFKSFSSDHIDGPVTMQDAVADLSDLYAFPTPNKKGFLTLALNASPILLPGGHFSEKVGYNFIIRQSSNAYGSAPDFTKAKELSITCVFFGEHKGHNNEIDQVFCQTSTGVLIQRKVGLVNKTIKNSMRLFAGRRSDPFFFNMLWAKGVSKDKEIPKKSSSNTMADLNVLSIVIDLKIADFFPASQNSLYAIAAESFSDESGSTKQFDRVGRPEMTNVTLDADNNNLELRDIYNLEEAFNLNAKNKDTYFNRFMESLNYYDQLDNKKQWTVAKQKKLINLLVDDYLLIDIEKPCTGDKFLDIEKSIVRGDNNYKSCGGRKLTDDIMDTLFTYYINADKGPRTQDGIDKPSATPSQKFPYLAKPSTGFKAGAKAVGIRSALYVKSKF